MAAGIISALPGVRGSQARAKAKPRRATRRPGWVAATAWLAILLGSLILVTWRQTRGIEVESKVRNLQGQQAVLETERLELTRRIEALRSRARVIEVARERLGMHLPSSNEIVFLPAPVIAPETIGEARE